MSIQEVVLLTSFRQVSEIQNAAELFAEQYGSVHIYIRGKVLGANKALIYLNTWHTVAAMNIGLNLMGVGDVSKDEENFCWVSPTVQGEIQLTTLQGERKPQTA